MADTPDCRHEASGCFRLAANETDPEIKTVLVSMARSWLLLAEQMRAAGSPREQLVEDIA